MICIQECLFRVYDEATVDMSGLKVQQVEENETGTELHFRPQSGHPCTAEKPGSIPWIYTLTSTQQQTNCAPTHPPLRNCSGN